MQRGLMAVVLAAVMGAAVAASATRMTAPYAFRCDDGAEFTISYVAQPAIAVLEYEGKAYELKPERTASGTRYAAVDARGAEISFWNKGDEALFEFPGQPPRVCRRI